MSTNLHFPGERKERREPHNTANPFFQKERKPFVFCGGGGFARRSGRGEIAAT